MERQGGSNGDPFKYIPIRFHQPSFPYVQRLAKPRREDGSPATIGDALLDVFPKLGFGESQIIILFNEEICEDGCV